MAKKSPEKTPKVSSGLIAEETGEHVQQQARAVALAHEAARKATLEGVEAMRTAMERAQAAISGANAEAEQALKAAEQATAAATRPPPTDQN